MKKLILLALFIPMLTPAAALTIDEVLSSIPSPSDYAQGDRSSSLLDMLSTLFYDEDDDGESTGSNFSTDTQTSPYTSHFEYTKQMIFPPDTRTSTTTDIATLAESIFSNNTEDNKKKLKKCFKFNFTKSLNSGARDDEVLALQKFLNQNSKTAIAEAGSGSKGSETEYFGTLTKEAVKKFQELFKKDILESVGLTEPTGFWGPSTINKANEITSLCK